MPTEYQRLRDAYNPDERCAPPPNGECTQVLESIEVHFRISVFVTSDQIQRLLKLVDEITQAPCNQPAEGVHWLSEYGSRPTWSQTDSRMLGLPVDPDAPVSGEPTFDGSIYAIGTCAREFVCEEERERKMKERTDNVS